LLCWDKHRQRSRYDLKSQKAWTFIYYSLCSVYPSCSNPIVVNLIIPKKSNTRAGNRLNLVFTAGTFHMLWA
jgi:hypothetical protein